MKNFIRFFLWTILGVAACAPESLSRVAPRIVVTPFGHTDSQVVDNRYESDMLTIDLGEVPLFSHRKARLTLLNDRSIDLLISKMEYSEQSGGDWLDPTWVNDPLDTVPKAVPSPSGDAEDETEQALILSALQSVIVDIAYAPTVEGPAEVLMNIHSNAANTGTYTIRVLATGVFDGAPDVQVEYNGYVGPVEGDCVDVDSDGMIDGCTVQPMDIGGVPLGSTASGRLTLRNVASCGMPTDVEACSTCLLTIRADDRRENVGIGFKAGTNDEGRFAFVGSTAMPLILPQEEQNCDSPSFVRIPVSFTAPDAEGDFSTTVVIESNVPGKPLIEIPVIASARNAPVAIAKLREQDPANPSSPWSHPDDLDPLGRVYFDGRDSFDTAGLPITDYIWEVVSHTGDAAYEFQWNGQGTPLADFVIPIAGDYTIRLTVSNGEMLSADTAEARVSIRSVPLAQVHVELVWDDTDNDQDLHMVNLQQDDRVCGIPWDVHWRNKNPVWRTDWPAGAGPNPTLDIDDTNGLGPENIRIRRPEPGVYRVFVHYFSEDGTSLAPPTRNTVRIYLNGLQVAEYRRTLEEEKALWAVADIAWFEDGNGTVTPYPSDSPGKVGSVVPHVR